MLATISRNEDFRGAVPDTTTLVPLPSEIILAHNGLRCTLGQTQETTFVFTAFGERIEMGGKKLWFQGEVVLPCKRPKDASYIFISSLGFGDLISEKVEVLIEKYSLHEGYQKPQAISWGNGPPEDSELESGQTRKVISLQLSGSTLHSSEFKLGIQGQMLSHHGSYWLSLPAFCILLTFLPTNQNQKTGCGSTF